MQRYRVVIMLVLFGVLPVVAAFFVALSFLGDEEPEQTQVEVAPVVEELEPPPPRPRRRHERYSRRRGRCRSARCSARTICPCFLSIRVRSRMTTSS